MIGYLRGTVLEVASESAIFLVGGIGYEVLCTGPVLQTLATHRDREQELWIYTHLREDVLQLFGFGSPEEKEFFLTLLKVNGIGPKMALSLLGGAHLEQIIAMIEAEDVKGLTQLPKVGKKTAEQMILSLKGKLVLSPRGGTEKKLSDGSPSLHLITSALVNFGYKPQEIERALMDFPRDMDVQEGVRRGLQLLAKPL